MQIETYRKAIPYKMIFPLLVIIFTSIFTYSLLNRGDLFWIYNSLAVVFFIIYVILLIKKPNYFYFKPRQSTLLIRFYNPHPFFSKPKAFEIPIRYFYSYEIKESFGGFRKFLIFKIKKGKEIGQYPRVSIVLLSENELNEMKKELDTILKIKKLK